MNERNYEVLSLYNQKTTEAAAGSVVDLDPSASAARREMKLMVVNNQATYQTAGSATYAISLTECTTTNGTFTAVAGDTLSNVTTADAVTEYHMRPKYRYVKFAVTTVGAGATSAGIAAILLNLKREA